MMEMSASDLAELHVLLEMYMRTYNTGDRDQALYREVGEHFETVVSTVKTSDGSVQPSYRNPRSAGRKVVIGDDKVTEVLRLRQAGQSMRQIAEMTGLSVSKVHRIIHDGHI